MNREMTVVAIAGVVVVGLTALAETAHTTRPTQSSRALAFDVASVKPNVSGGNNFGVTTRESGMVATN